MLNDGNEMVLMYKWTNTIFRPKRIRLFALIINCIIVTRTNSRFSRNVYAISNRIWCNKHLRQTTTKNMITMGKLDTSDLMMIITWAIDTSFQSPLLKWASWTHTNPYIWWKQKVIERTSSMFTTHPQDTLQTFTCVQCLRAVLYADDNGRL